MLAGGAGSRFWPASRRSVPKPFVPLLGDRTLFDATLERVRAISPPRRTWVVSAQELAATTRAALRRHRGVRLLLEPVARDTAAAVAWAAASVSALDREAVIGLFPADHHIPNPRAWERTIRSAAQIARRGDELVLVGIEPVRPDSAYGYIRTGARGPGASLRVRGFAEKPSPQRARRLLRTGRALWNTGMIIARVDRILEECREHAPEVWAALGRILTRTSEGQSVSRVTLARAYRRVKAISFDRAVLERTERVLVLRGRFRWSDLGSWDALSANLRRWKGQQVSGTPPLVSLDAHDNLIWNPSGKPLALVGLSGFVVVNTDDALLICPKDRAQDVRRVVDELSRRGRGDLT